MKKNYVLILAVVLVMRGVFGGWAQVAKGADRFSIGDSVRVVSSITNLNVRPGPSVSSGSVTLKNGGDIGAIVEGPVVAEGYNWWKINWAGGTDTRGWSAEWSSNGTEFYLEKTNQPVIVGVYGSRALVAGQSYTWSIGLYSAGYATLKSVDWGDGTPSEPQEEFKFTHTYLKSGTYVATFTVKGGGTSSISVTITVTTPISTPTSTVSTRFSKGDNVRALVDDLQVRENPPATLDENPLGRKYFNDLGSVIDGPILSASYQWWKIRWNDGVEGWSAEGSLIDNFPIEIYLEKCPAEGCGTVGGGTTPTSTPSTRFKIGDNVRIVLPGIGVQVNRLSDQSEGVVSKGAGAEGVIIDGPVFGSLYKNWAWKIRWSDGVEGWSGESYNYNGPYLFEKFTPGEIGIMARVRVTGDYLQVRPLASLSGKAQGFRMKGDLGKVIAGPQSSNNYKWWKVDYDTGVDGWSAENWLELAGSGGTGTPTSTATLTIPTNSPPAVFGVTGPISLATGTVGTWTVLASDPDGDTLFSYSVVWGDGATGAAQSGSSFTHTYSTTGTYTARFTVNDGKANGSTSFDVRISVAPPKFVAGDRVKVVFHNASEAGSSNCVSNPKPPDVNWGGWSINDGALGTILEGPYYVGDQTRANLWKIQFDIPVGSACWFWERSLEKLTPISTNSPPVVSGVTGPTSLTAGTAGTWTVSASDPDGDALLYSVVWGDGATSIAQSGSSFTHTYATAGAYTAIFMVRDSEGVSTDKPVAIVISGGVAQPTSTPTTNRVPVIYEIIGPKDPTTLNAGVAGTWRVSASDPDGDPISYSVEWGDRTTSAPQSSPVFIHTYQSAGNYNAYFSLSDGKGSGGGGLPIAVTWLPSSSSVTSTKFIVNDKVWVTAPQVQVRSVPEAGVVAQRNTGDSGVIIGGPKLYDSYWWWQVNYGDSWTYDIGSDGWTAENWLTKTALTVPNNAPTIPTIVGPNSITNSAGTGSWTISSYDIDGDALTYSVVWGDGTTSAAQSGSSFTHSFPRSGNYGVVFTATDSKGKSSSMTLSVSVTGMTTTSTPTSTPPTTKFVVGNKIWVTAPSVRVKDNPTGTIVGIKNTGNPGTVIGGPKFADTYWWWQVDYDVAPDGWSAENWLKKIDPPVISGVTSPASLGVGVSGTWTVSASDPNSDTLSYSATWGDGTSSGPQGGSSFTHTYSAVGTYTATFTVSDGKGGSASRAVTVTLVGSTKFVIGSRIRVTAPSVQVRSILEQTATGWKNTGDLGTVVGGPRFYGTYWWWQIDYANTTDGWSAENWLEKVAGSVWIQESSPATYTASAIQSIQLQLNQVVEQLRLILEQLR